MKKSILKIQYKHAYFTANFVWSLKFHNCKYTVCTCEFVLTISDSKKVLLKLEKETLES